MTTNIPLIDLGAQRQRLGEKLGAAVTRVIEHGAYVQGPEVRQFEARLQEYSGARHVVSCANGTDAITLVLMAEGIGQGDAVFVPTFTFVATAEAPAQLGATPVFVDVAPDTFNMDPQSLRRAIDHARANHLTPRAIIAVDLFGQPADYDALREIARRDDLVLIADAAQALGGARNGERVGTLADYTTTSFFPAKPLGCYGDGGAVFTNDDDNAAIVRSLALHGQGTDKYDNVRIGLNSRLDTIQAAILLEKLSIFDDEIAARQEIVARYRSLLGENVTTPHVPAGVESVWALFTIKSSRRDAVAKACADRGIASAVYYRIPLHRQTGYLDYPVAPAGAPVSEQLSAQVLSLPMHPYLTAEDQARIADALVGVS